MQNIKISDSVIWKSAITISLTLIYIYFLLVIKPFLHYHLQQTGFISDFSFFIDHLSHPGGITEYIANLIFQFFYFNWAGPLVITICCFSLGYLSYHICLQISDNKYFIFLNLIPSLLFILLVGNYYFPISIVIGVILSLLFVILISKIINKKLFFLWFLLISCLAYYITGGGAFIFYMVISILFIISKLNIKFIIAGLLQSIAMIILIPYISFKYIFNISYNDVYLYFFPDVPIMIKYKISNLLYLFYLSFPLVSFSILLLNKLPILHSSKKTLKNIKKKNVIKLKFRLIVPVIILISVTYVTLQYSVNEELKNKRLIKYYADNQLWDKVIECSTKDFPYDYQTNFEFVRALFHSGKLTSNLFDYPQLAGSDALFPDKFKTGEITMPASDLYYDMGFIAESQRWAYEGQTLLPYSPKILKRLIINNLILRNFNLSKKFMDVLNKNFLYKNWVKEHSKYINDTSLIDKNQEFAEKRSFSPQNDIIPTEPTIKLKILLDKNNNNKMAYEYLQCHYLLNNMLGDFCKYLKFDNNFYKNTPKTFEEGLVIYLTKVKNPDEMITKIPISNNTKMNFASFNQAMLKFKENTRFAKETVKKSYSKTYWYYMFFENPKVTNAKMKTKEVEQ